MKKNNSPNPSLQPLEMLTGKWQMVLSNASFLEDPTTTVESVATFEWIKGGAYLLMIQGDETSPPFACWMIGRDESSNDYTVLYSDGRGVSRVYQMAFNGEEWKLWRSAPGFHQRFAGEVSSDGKQINASWEKSEDGKNWQHDFDITYRKN